MLVLSLERVTQPLQIDPVDRTVVAGGGVLLSQLDAALEPHGLMFPIDLGADPTIGGMVVTNTGGTRLLRYGDVRQNLLGIEVVLADGSVLELMSALRKNNTGLDVKQLFVGTSGAFGVVTRALLRVVPRPVQRATALVGAQDGATVLALLAHLERAVGDVLTAFEVISADALAPVFRYQPRLRSPFGAALPPFAVLVELSTTLPDRTAAARRPARVCPRRARRRRAGRRHQRGLPGKARGAVGDPPPRLGEPPPRGRGPGARRQRAALVAARPG